MSNLSVGPTPSGTAQDEKRKAPDAPAAVGAQGSNEKDTRRGLAGVEAKPLRGGETDATNGRVSAQARHRPGDSETAPDEPNDMIGGQRNARHEDDGNVPPESEEQDNQDSRAR